MDHIRQYRELLRKIFTDEYVPDQEDIDVLISQTNCTVEKARAVLIMHDGDIADSIIFIEKST